MKLLRFYIGVGEDKKGQVISSPSRDKMLADARELLAKHFGGYTEIDARGGWTGPTALVSEPSVIFEIMVPQASPHGGSFFALIAEELKAIFNQSSVLYTVSEVKGEFV